ncbi:MAG: DegT/DnrJ/EryC1/StrS family aminotransferase [Gammaproteobacteria bacterium]|nr:DegT/DnrJ/EryC1/StrS family aminotransferase [Gammaproteobacteria bacterium]
MHGEKKVSVPLLDLKSQYGAIRSEVRSAIDEVCDEQHFVMGPKVVELEEKIAAYSGCKYGIGVSSGTDALLVALMALEIGSGDAVITTPYTFFATGGTISRVGARPIFCDIEPDTYNISPDAVRRVLEEECDLRNGEVVHRPSGTRIKAIMPVHLYGQTADQDALLDIARDAGVHLIEDAAQSIGSEYSNGGRAGSTGTIGCFSFFPSKNLGAFGDGGMCTTNDENVAERLRILRLHGGKPKYYHSVIGGNFRLDALQAAVLLVKLPYLDGWTAARQRNASFYDNAFASAGLGASVQTPLRRTGRRHIYNQYVIRVQDRDGLRRYLSDAQIGTEIYYPVPLHIQKCFAYLNYKEGDCPEAERAAAETVAIPVYPELSGEQLNYVVKTVADYYR